MTIQKSTTNTILIIRTFNGCEVLIENSVTRVTVRHHEACRVMPHSYPSDGIFKLHRRTIMDSFFLHTPTSTIALNSYNMQRRTIKDFFFLHTLPSTIVFRLEYVLFYQFTLKCILFSIKNSSVRLLSYTFTSKYFAETDVKMTSKRKIMISKRQT